MIHDNNVLQPTPSILSFALAPASQVYQAPDFVDDFLEHILGLKPSACMLTDNSDLGDFCVTDKDYEECWAAIEKRYKVKQPEAGMSSLADIFNYLIAHGQIEGRPATSGHTGIDLDELKDRPVVVNEFVVSELLRKMTAEQRQYAAFFAHAIKQPAELWIQHAAVNGLTKGYTWLRTYIAFFNISPDHPEQAVGVAVRFHLRAEWELFSMEAFAGEPTWVSHQIERFRFGYRPRSF